MISLKGSLTLFIMVFQVFVCKPTYAAKQITSFGYPYGIVGDNNEWTCEVKASNTSKFSQALNYTADKLIKGNSKSLPMTFEFLYCTTDFGLGSRYGTSQHVLDKAHSILAKYAIETNSVISNVSIKGDSKTHYTVFGCFFDNKSSGYFAIHIMLSYVMFVELRSEFFDEPTREVIISKPFELITPLYNPKHLYELLGIDIQGCDDVIFVED